MTESTEYIKGSAPSDSEDESGDKRPCLVMIRGDHIGQIYDLKTDVVVIGRSDDVDLTISDISMSRRHAMIVRRAEGFFLSDLSSTNGCFVNKNSVTDAIKLEEGDKVMLGKVLFKFTFQDADDTEYHEQLRDMAIKDGLTGIYNKAFFTEAFEKECEYNRRNQGGLSIILFDIDHFKQVNDTWGHPAGDFILKNMARLIEDKARGYDVFARYGGEEFAFLLRGTPMVEAIALAERVRGELEAHVFDYDGVELKITASFGVSSWDGDSKMEDAEFIEAVDKRLYEAKNAGRNCVRHDPLDTE